MPGCSVLLSVLLTVSLSSRCGVCEASIGSKEITNVCERNTEALRHGRSKNLPIDTTLRETSKHVALSARIKSNNPDLVFSIIKLYTESTEFKMVYRSWRELRRPAANSMKDVEILAQRKQLVAAINLQQQIIDNCFDCSEMEFSRMRSSISVLKERLKILSCSDPVMAMWENLFPQKSEALVANLINRFIDITSDIDYKAAVKKSGEKISFVNPYYEQKDYVWKFCFHAGKETTDTLRKLAKDWLEEISNK